MYSQIHIHKALLILCFLSNLCFAQNTTNVPHIDSTLTKKAFTEEGLLSPLNKIGEGKLNILFWKVYKAEFFASTTPYVDTQYPKALKLTYQRNIKKNEFIEATQDQWNKLRKKQKNAQISQQQEQKWLKQLTNIFPDIHENDVILLIIDQNKQASFYFQGFDEKVTNTTQTYQPLGTINAPFFSEHFLSIWLSPYTTEPKLRKQLIGQ